MQNKTKGDQNALFTLDKLEISIRIKDYLQEITDKTKDIIINDSFIMELTHKKTPIFNSVYNIKIDGMVIFDLWCNPNPNLLDIDRAVLRYKNEILYSDHVKNFYTKAKNSLNFLFQKIKALDIAADMEKTKEMDKFQYQFASSKINFVGSPSVTIQKKGDKIEYFRIGSRSSDKFIRTYDKRQELKVSNKKYIAEYWKENGFNEEKEIFRVELALKGSLLHKIASFDFLELDETGGKTHYLPFLEERTLDIIQEPRFLHDIFESQSKRIGKFYKSSDYKKNDCRANRVKKYLAFTFIKPKNIIFHLYKIKDQATKVIHKIKMLSKFLTELGLETKNEFYTRLSESVASFEQMEKWREKMLPRWNIDTNRKLKSKHYKNYICRVGDKFNISLNTYIFGRLPLNDRERLSSHFNSSAIKFYEAKV
jgi:hypothetical protein